MYVPLPSFETTMSALTTDTSKFNSFLSLLLNHFENFLDTSLFSDNINLRWFCIGTPVKSSPALAENIARLDATVRRQRRDGEEGAREGVYGVLQEPESKAVMMAWEKPLMDPHAKAFCSGGWDDDETQRREKAEAFGHW